MDSPLTITFRLAQSLEQRGYCILGAHELEQLFSHAGTEAEKLRLLHELAEANGASVEVGPRLRSAKLSTAKITTDTRRNEKVPRLAQ